MYVLRLVEYLSSIGHELSVEGEQIRIKRGKHLPPQLKEQVKQNKPEIIEMLERDQEARKIHFLVGITGTLYSKSVSRKSVVYIEQFNDIWKSWRETYREERKQAVSYKTICEDESFYYVLQKASDYFKYIERRRSTGYEKYTWKGE